MMKNRFLAAAMAVLAGFAFVSCDELEQEVEKVIEVSISAANAEFDANGEASVNLALNYASYKDITVILGISAEAESGYTAIEAANLDFESSVTIPAGAQTVPVKVAVDKENVKAGQEAVITIASANGATVGKNAVAYIKVPANGYENEKPEPGVDLSGATVWSIIGAFNNWEGDVELTKTDGEEWKINGFALSGEFKFRGNKEWGNYDLGAEAGAQIVFGEALPLVHKGANIVIPQGIYDIVLYPTQFKAVFSPVETPPVDELNWTVKYNGCIWVEGLYNYGQLESFEVSGTDTQKFYMPVIVDLDEDGDLAAEIAADPEAFFASLQEDVDSEIAGEMEDWDETLEEAIAELYYNELNDGTEVLFLGYPAGNYQFVVLPIDATGKLDKTWKAISFSKTEDAASIYPWHESYNKRSDWNVAWDGWVEGDEGDYYWVAGNAPGANYVAVDSYTADELDYYYDGNMVDMYNYTASNLADYIAAGFTIEELAYYGLVSEVEQDGTFSASLSTYQLTGETNVYIIAFDATGKILGDYGVSVVDVPEYVPEPINWVERTDWAANFDATVDTGETDYPDAIVTTVCDADFFITKLFVAGALADNGIDAIGQSAASQIQQYIGWGYTMDELVNDYGVVHDSVPVVDAWSGLYDGVEIFIIGLNEDGSATGEWHMEVLTGYVEKPKDLPEMTLVEGWSVTPAGEAYLDTDGYEVVDIEVNAPDILWYYIEENSDEDLEYYYEGNIANLAYGIENSIAKYIDSYTMDDLLWSNSSPQTTIDVYNPNVPTSIYIVEFDENGKATGRYGKTDVTIVYNDAEASAPAKAKANVHKTTLKVKKAAVKAAPAAKDVTIVRKHAGQKRVETSLEISAKNVKTAKAGTVAKKHSR